MLLLLLMLETALYWRKKRILQMKMNMTSMVQAHDFLLPGPKRRKAPEGWWKKAINPPKPKPKETVLEIGAPATATQAAKPGAVKSAAKGANRLDSRYITSHTLGRHLFLRKSPFGCDSPTQPETVDWLLCNA